MSICANTVLVPTVTHAGRYSTPRPRCNAEFHHMQEFVPFGGKEGEEDPTLVSDDISSLNVVTVDMLQQSNKVEHHTARYDSPQLIIRRGQEFFVSVTFNRPLSPTDKFQLEFMIGANPTVSKESMIVVPFYGSPGGSWTGRRVNKQGAMVTLGITPNPKALVGKFQSCVAILIPSGIIRTKRDPSTDLYLLFNAWCPDDEVFLNNDTDRNEYVLNDYGVLYMGNVDAVSHRMWLYGQFERGVLDACIYILDACNMPIDNRGSSIYITRQASAMINSEDDDGVIVGRWDEDYSLGTAPDLWTGSTQILLKYASTRTPVRYGQCWVFAGVFNSFLRCLGIPSRVVTNYGSAHDNDGKIKIDIIFLPNGERDKVTDSIWNYHCWNEAYMSRSDLPAGLGGWQVVDATPQETGSGYYCCGPASVKAVKEGQVSYPFDMKFVFAEVASYVVFQKRDEYGVLTPFHTDKTCVGKLVLTKSVDSDEPADITNTYKYPVAEEIRGFKTAGAKGISNDEPTSVLGEDLESDNPELPGTTVTASILVNQVQLEQDFTLVIEFTNLGGVELKIQANLSGSVAFYTGVPSEKFKDENVDVTVSPYTTERVLVNVLAVEYMPNINFQSNLYFTLVGHTTDNQDFATVKVLTLQVPTLSIEVSEPPHLGQVTYVTVSFTNPFTFSLDDVSISCEGSGLLDFKIKQYSVIAPNDTITWVESCCPKRTGKSRLCAFLDCNKLRRVSGILDVLILP
ncbi:coagulation factor XIII A chain-like isoform X2 [Osmerus eperlanus]|uniref:coagulation factor XIII A chain-like isoform X2 n=1 Tax=Osmerus eperlanus TaxID=29151 RepID=UPI002E0FFC33